MKISICIPTYNRAAHLKNCLQSIIQNTDVATVDFQVCISDNGSADDTEAVVRSAEEFIPIIYNKNSRNLGIPSNFLKVVDMASGEFAWLLGDDDLLMPDALVRLTNLIDQYQEVDFFFTNSFHLTSEYIQSYPQPFDIRNLPDTMVPFSSWCHNGEMRFMDLINPKVSFDFLGGMFLSVFRRKNWAENVNVLDQNAVSDPKIFTNFDNTFPHVKIFSKAFANSKAYFNDKPLNVCLSGLREWAPMYPLVRSVRIVESLYEYRKNGLPYLNFLRCKNSALKFFIPDLLNMFINKDYSGIEYIKPFRLILQNCIYPNFYLSFFLYFFRKFKQLRS